MDTYSYTEWAAQQRAGGPGLSPGARVDAMIALSLDDLYGRVVRQRRGTDAAVRRDLREQFAARMEAL